MSLMIGIVSYMPNDDTVRTKRLTASRTQIEWLHKVLPNEKKVVVAQNYELGELAYLKANYTYSLDVWDEGRKPLGAGTARNMVLQYFYNSDYDWLFLLDDDTILDDKYSPENLLYELRDNPEKFKMVDAISAVEPEYHPYKKLNYQDKNNLDHYKFEPRELNSGSATSIIRNIKKTYGEEIYYPNVDAMKGEGREDIEFLLQWLKADLNWYTMQTWIRKSLCFDYSSIFGFNVEERDKILMKDLDVICKKYAEDGLQRNVNGQITWREFNRRYNHSFATLYIPREKHIVFEDNVIPKVKQTSKKLF